MRWRWDTPRDADEFEDRLRGVYGDLGVVARRDGQVTLVIADSPDVAKRLAGA